MPGPVSQSFRTPPDPPIKQAWQRELAEAGSRYFVLCIDDVFAAFNERDIKALDRLLRKYNEHRAAKGSQQRRYYVARRDWQCGPQIKKLIEAEFGIRIKE